MRAESWRDDGVRPATRASGFSLVEILVSIVITGIVGAALVGVLGEQRDFYQGNSRFVTAQKSLRGAVDWMSTELRMGYRGGVQVATADSLIVKYPVVQGVVCDTTPSSTVYINLYRHAASPDSVEFLAPRYRNNWQSGPAWTEFSQNNHSQCPGSPPTGQRYWTDSWSGALPAKGSMIRGTRLLSYSFRPRNGEVLLFRDGRRLAGPFEQSSPYFRYFRANGTELSAPVTGSSRDAIASVMIDVTALGHDPHARYDAKRTIELRVPFRN